MENSTIDELIVLLKARIQDVTSVDFSNQIIVISADSEQMLTAVENGTLGMAPDVDQIETAKNHLCFPTTSCD